MVNLDIYQPNIEAVESALSEGGVLHNIARQLTDFGGPLTNEEVGDILLPQKDTTNPRWVMRDGVDGIKKDLYEQNEQAIADLARTAGILQDESLPQNVLEQIDRSNVLTIVETGSNKTFVVRPALAEAALSAVGLNSSIYIATTSNMIDLTLKDGKPNPAHKIISDLAPGYLDSTRDFSEFQAAVAVAMQSGYNVADSRNYIAHAEQRTLSRIDQSTNSEYLRKIVRPYQNSKVPKGFLGTLSFLLHCEEKGKNLLEGKQLLLVTNGQYRTKLGMMASKWAMANNVELAGNPIVTGDEAGFSVNHLGQDIVTAQRKANTYIPELVVIYRINRKP
jgi:hypothetical protein